VGIQEILHVTGMFFLDRQNGLQHDARGRIVVAEEANQFAVVMHRNTFRDQIFWIMAPRLEPVAYSDAD
jgi:hypothetical protein